MKSIITDKKECWVDIPNYEGLYQISNYGRVRSLKKWCGNKQISKYIDEIKVLKPMDNGNGYLYIFLNKHRKRKRFYIHRLVAMMFLKKEGNSNVVNHKDFNKKNNHVENLEWCTQRHNVIYSTKNMQKPHKSQVSKITNEKYIRFKDSSYELTIRGKYLGRFKTLEEAINKRNEMEVVLWQCQ